MSIVLDGSNATTGGLINSGTAQNSTSGTSVLFTGIPATAKRITVMFNGVKTSGSSLVQVQVGAGSITTTGYTGNYFNCYAANTIQVGNNGTGFLLGDASASDNRYGHFVFTLISGNIWVCSANLSGNGGLLTTSGSISLSSALDRVVVTTVNGTDTFTAGSINILWE
jgi:hypothetical protein